VLVSRFIAPWYLAQLLNDRLCGVRTLLLATLSLLVAFVPVVHGEDSPNTAETRDTSLRRFEIGPQTADLRTGCIGSTFSCYLPSFALGGAGVVNINQHFSLDAGFLVTPQTSSGSTNLDGGRGSEFLVGARAEARGRNYGFFLKVQPGYLHWSKAITGVSFPTPATFVFSYGGRTYFASNMGAGLEYSPSPRIHVRGEVTDLLLRYGASSWSNNVQPSAGVYYALGKPLPWTPPVYEARRAHAFMNKTNVALITSSVLAMTADAVTTQRDLAHGGREGDPFARPLVKYGWSGQISAMSLEISAEVLGMYGLHRIGQHWVERAVPASLAVAHSIFAYNNANFSFSAGGSQY
jgi:hypothetical protein